MMEEVQKKNNFTYYNAPSSEILSFEAFMADVGLQEPAAGTSSNVIKTDF
jgi:hypothetical protein